MSSYQEVCSQAFMLFSSSRLSCSPTLVSTEPSFTMANPQRPGAQTPWPPSLLTLPTPTTPPNYEKLPDFTSGN